MSLQQECFECSKPAMLTCQQCLNEFDEPKSFCLPCDRRIHGLLSKLTDHKRIDCRNNVKQIQNVYKQGNEDISLKEETKGTNLRDNNPYSSILKEGQYFQNRKSEENQLRPMQQQITGLNKLQDYKKQNYSSPSNVLNNYQLRKDEQIGLSNGDQNEHSKEDQKIITEGKRDNLLFFKDLKQLSPGFEQKKSLIPQSSSLSSNQNKQFSQEFENRYQLRQQQTNKTGDKSWDPKKFEEQQEKELDNRRSIENQKLEDTQTVEQSSSKQLNQVQINEGLSFKDKLQREIMALKQKQLDKIKEEERPQEKKVDENCNYDKGYEKDKIATAQEEYREVKQDLQKFFGKQSDIDARENDVLKRISEIKTRLTKGSEDINNIRTTTVNSYENNKEEKVKEELISKRSFSIGRYQDGKNIERTNTNGQYQIDSRRPQEKVKFQDIYFQKKESMELDSKLIGKSREQDGVVSSLRQHMDLMEERNNETIRTIQIELLKEQRRNAENEQQWRNIVADIKSQFEAEVNQLRIQVQAEKARVVSSERTIEDQQAMVSHKLFEAAEAKKKAKQEIDEQRLLMEEKMQEMNGLLDRAKTEGREEAERNYMEEKEDLEVLLGDIQEELRVKSEEWKQKEDKIISENATLLNETSKLNKIITDLKSSNESLSMELAQEREEKQQLRDIAVIQEGELEVQKRQRQNLEEQIKSLQESTELLDKQLARYQKQIYGHKKDKNKSSLKKISSLSNVSLSQITHTSIPKNK